MGYKKSDPIVKKAINYIGSKKLKSLYPDDITIKNEFFEVEAVFISAIAHVNDGYSFYSFGRDFAFLFYKTMHIIKDAYSDLICSINQKDKDNGQ